MNYSFYPLGKVYGLSPIGNDLAKAGLLEIIQRRDEVVTDVT